MTEWAKPFFLHPAWWGEPSGQPAPLCTTYEDNMEDPRTTIDALVAALEFYADEGRWREFSRDEYAGAFDRNTGSDFGSDTGATARAALALARGGK